MLGKGIAKERKEAKADGGEQQKQQPINDTAPPPLQGKASLF